jgi:pimeloyl-ACP methyl ester carboxylesterase
MKLLVNGVELHYEKSGEGRPLLLLHGNGEDLHIFDEIFPKLARDFAVYAIDSRNHGESGKTDECSYEAMAEDIYLFIRELNLNKVNIVGFSDGAIVSLILAMRHGEVMEKMALLGVNLKPEDLTEEFRQFVIEKYEETKDPLLEMILEQPNIDIEEAAKVSVPTLVVAAENDICDYGFFARLSSAMPDAELKIVKGHSHDSYVVNQDILYPDFVSFFGRQ